MNKGFWLLVILLYFPLAGHGQLKGVKNFKWPDKPELSPVSERLKNEDAYIIKERQSISITMDSKGIHVYTSIKRKLKILTQAGVDHHARIVLPKNAGRRITLADARTIKKDGSIVDLDVDQIKEVKIAHDDKIFNPSRHILFAVPGVEPGDEIEIIAGYSGYGMDIGQNIYLHSYLASLQSEVIINQVKAVILDIHFYNKLAYPTKKENSTNVTYTWEAYNLPSLEQQSGSVPTLDLPYISYVVKKVVWGPGNVQDVVGDAWTSILDFGGKYYVYDKIGPNYRENKLDDFLEERWKEKSATTVVDKVKTIHDWMNKHMKVEDLPENESTLSLITYVNNRKIDHQNLFKLYHYLLFRTSPDYALCMARDFYDGPIDFAFVAFHQINYILYSFKDEAGATHYVIPQDDDENKYELDEIDGRIQGTKYISMNLKNKNHEITNPKLPFNAPVDNTRSRMAKAELDLETGNAALKFDETIQGVYSTNARHFYMKNEEDSTLKKEFVSLMKERNETAQVDSISVTSYETTFPFTFKLNYHLTIGNVVSKVDEKLYAVSTEKWFYHTLDKVNPQTRNMDYYFPNLGRDIFKYYLVFPTNVSLVNGEKIKKSIQQPFSTYSLDITQVNPTTILVESSFQVRQVHVPLAEITKLSEMIQKIEEADNEPVMVKVL